MSNIENIYLGSEKIAMREAQAELFELIRENNPEKMRSFGARIDEVARTTGCRSLSVSEGSPGQKEEPKMKCPYCGFEDTRVIDSRPSGGSLRHPKAKALRDVSEAVYHL